LQAGYSSAGPIVKSRISADAEWVVHVDNDTFNKSRLGQIVRAEMVKRGMEEKFRNFKEMSSFHPLDDINNITIYGQGKKEVALIQGKFDKSKILAFVRANPHHKQIEYHGINIQQWGRSAETEVPFPVPNEQIMSGGFYDDDLIVLSADLSAIERAFDVLEGSQPSAANSFFDNIDIQSKNTFLQAIIANDAPGILDNAASTVILKNTNRLVLEIGEIEKSVFVKIILNAYTKDAAEGIKKLLDGIAAYLILAGKEKPELAELAQQIKISNIENTVQINFESEPDLIMRMIPQRFPWE